MNEYPEIVVSLAQEYKLQALQLHGDESVAYIQKLKDQYEECYGIYLHYHEITMIEEEEPINLYQGA